MLDIVHFSKLVFDKTDLPAHNTSKDSTVAMSFQFLAKTLASAHDVVLDLLEYNC